jgi:hypothetical protein
MNSRNEILEDILLRMFYDVKKTKLENSNLVEQRVPSTTQSDRLSSANVTPPQMQAQMKNPELYRKGLSMEYRLPERPEKPVKSSSIVTTPGKVIDDAEFEWKLPYYSPRAEIILCEKPSCKCVGTKGKLIPICKSKNAKSEFEEIYKIDLEDYKKNHKALVDIGEILTNPHLLLPLAAIAATFYVGGIGGVLVGGLLDAADINLYVQEGNELAAGLGAIFLLIPAHQLANFIPGYRNLTKGFVKNLLNKVSKKLPLNKAEASVLDSINKNLDEIAKLAAKNAALNSTKFLVNEMNLRQLLVYLLYMIKFGLFSSKWSIRIAGVVYTVAALAKKLGLILVGVNDKTILTEEQKKQPVTTIEKNETTILEVTRQAQIQQIEKTDSTQKLEEITKVNNYIFSKQDSLDAYFGI